MGTGCSLPMSDSVAWVQDGLSVVNPAGSGSFTLLHLGGTTTDATLLFIVLGGITSSALASVSVLAFSQRRSRPYLFISLALGMLAAKAFVGGLTVFDVVSAPTHHMVEHALDFATALCLVTAVVFARVASNRSADRLRADEDDGDESLSEQ